VVRVSTFGTAFGFQHSKAVSCMAMGGMIVTPF